MKLKNVLIVAAILLAVLIGWQAYNYIISRPLTATLDLLVAPTDSRITLNGKTSKAGKIKVRPGEIKVQFSREGFATVTKTVKVNDGETKFVGVALASNSINTQGWYQNHPKDAQIAESISSQNSDQIAEQITNTTPIIKNLPFIDEKNGYRIDYGQSQQHPDDPNAVAIYITIDSKDQTTAKNSALSWIRFSGYDPNNLEIIYKYPTSSNSANPNTEE